MLLLLKNTFVVDRNPVDVIINGRRKSKDMKNDIPVFIQILFKSCVALSKIMGGMHMVLVQMNIFKIHVSIQCSVAGVRKQLQHIWLTRLMRRIISVLVRSPFRKEVLKLVDFPAPESSSGCVITACHSPWSRLLVQWNLEHDFALIIVTGDTWVNRAKHVNRKGRGIPELREIITHLRTGGRLILTADAFIESKTCTIDFFGKTSHVSQTPYRLAKMANVPLVAVAPILINGKIRVHERLRFYPGQTDFSACQTMQSLLAFYEREINKFPEIWSTFVMGSLSKA